MTEPMTKNAAPPALATVFGNLHGARPLCKVCGLRRAEDAALCAELGVDLTGFIFVPGSPRQVSPAEVKILPRSAARRVGVFAGAAFTTIRDCAREARLDFVQLHGGESPDFCRRLGPERIIKVLWPEGRTDGELRDEMERFAPVCAFFLLDAGVSGGGSGKRLPLELLSRLRAPRPWFLAGGLGPDTLEAALAACSPDGLDLNSCLESAPGVKDAARLRRALDIIHAAIEANTHKGKSI